MGFSTDDTIVAVATPPGRAGLGVVRLSGPEALRIASDVSELEGPLAPRHATLAIVRGAGAQDQAVMTYFPAPHSYTAEDVVEISAHGSPLLLRAIVAACMQQGARLAERGEFTLRAFLHGRVDLVQAEAVRDLVDAVTPLQARAAFDQLEGTLTAAIRRIDADLFDLTARLEASLDFPEEGYHFVDSGGAAGEIEGLIATLSHLLRDAQRGRLLREGGHVVIAGRPNTGKSSLFNALAGAGRAIVTDVPGTTRDLLTETVDLGGIPVTFVDTAGVHGSAADAVEAEGMARAHAARTVAALLVVVVDRSRPLEPLDRELVAEANATRSIVVVNKVDLAPAWDAHVETPRGVPVCALTGAGVEQLREELAAALARGEAQRDAPAVTNVRHAELLQRAHGALERAAAAARERTPEEFVLADLREARAALEEVTGTRTPEETLRAIFDRFCVGK